MLGEPPIRSAPRRSRRGSGLETTGITLPLTRVADKVRTPEREPSPILIGRSNALVERLVKIGKARLDDLKPGEGAVQIVPKAFGNATATVVAGADAAGTDAAASYLARRVPYVWDNARGSISLGDVALQANRFLQARTAAGQASQIDTELDALVGDMKGKSLESVDVKLYVEQADPALDTYVAEKLRTAGIQGAGEGDERRHHRPGHGLRRHASTCRGRSTTSGRSSRATCCRR